MGLNMNYLKFSTLLVAMTLFTSCMKPVDKEIDFGPEVDSDVIGKTIFDSYGEFNPSDLRKGDFVEYQIVQVLGGVQERLIRQIGISVFDKVPATQDGTPGFVITIVRETIDYSTGENPTPVVEQYPNLFIPSEQTFSANKSIRPLSSKSTVTYHNFKKAYVSEAPPKAVAQSAGCAEIANCMLNVLQMSYDVVEKQDGQDPNKISVYQKVSPEVPFIVRLVDYDPNSSGNTFIPNLNLCNRVAVKVENQPILVTTCQNVVNFVRGPK